MSEVHVDWAIKVLNEALEMDPVAISALFDYRVPCNDKLYCHCTIQVTPDKQVGLLGILNGLFGICSEGPKKGYGYISMVVSGKGIVRFERTKDT